MANIFIIHGTFGSPEENWFFWIKGELENAGQEVFVPAFPTPENQSLDSWIKVFEKQEGELDENSVLIGHSLGCAFILNLLERTEVKIKLAVLVSGFVGALGNPKFDELNKSFADRVFDWNKIRENCKKFLVIHSDNDPHVPIEKAKELARNLGAEIEIVKEAGHFNEAAGYIKFELLLERLIGELDAG